MKTRQRPGPNAGTVVPGGPIASADPRQGTDAPVEAVNDRPARGEQDRLEDPARLRASAVVRGEGGAAIRRSAATEAPATLGSMAEADQLVRELVARDFPELRDTRIVVEGFDHDTDFFRSSVKPLTALGLGRRTYVIQVNREVFQRGLPREAARAILAHELGHTLDFIGRNSLELIGVAATYLSRERTARMERRTDLQAVARGHAAGLARYRDWLYRQIDPEAVARKQHAYFTPAELAALPDALAGRPELLARWLEDPPRSLAEIQAAAG